jgi:hypothetical protein
MRNDGLAEFDDVQSGVLGEQAMVQSTMILAIKLVRCGR